MDPTQDQRSALSTRVFLEPDQAQVGEIVLRRVTLGSLALLRQSGNEFLSPQGPVVEVLDETTGLMVQRRTIVNELFAALAYGYIHSAELGEVRRAVFSESFFREKVLEFGERLLPEQLATLVKLIEESLAAIASLQFAVQPKPKDGASGPEQPPN